MSCKEQWNGYSSKPKEDKVMNCETCGDELVGHGLCPTCDCLVMDD